MHTLFSCLLTSLLGVSANVIAANEASSTPAAADPNLSITESAPIRALIKAINPDSVIKAVKPSPLPGFKTVIADSTVLYVTDDARYVMYGVLLDTKEQRNLTDGYLADVYGDLLKTIPEKVKLTFSPKNPKYTVTVFTDVTCGYCKALHKEIQSYVDAGIRVDYVPWPREGAGSATAQNMKNVWCAKDPQAAFAAAIGGTMPAKVETCAMSDNFEKVAQLGEKLGIDGTPSIFDAQGHKLGGYISAQTMLSKLAKGDHVTRDVATK